MVETKNQQPQEIKNSSETLKGSEFPARIRIGRRESILPGLSDNEEIEKNKQVLNQLAFRLVTNNEVEVYAYPDSNGDGVLTPDEIRGLVNNKIMQGHWPEGQKEQLSAMLDPANPSPLVAIDKTALPLLNIKSSMPRLVPEAGMSKFRLSAYYSFYSAAFTKVNTSSETGNRYLSLDQNADGAFTLGELKEVYSHPEVQAKLSPQIKAYYELLICYHSGLGISRKEFGQYTDELGEKDITTSRYPGLGEAIDHFQVTGKFSAEKQAKLENILPLALADSSKDRVVIYSVNKYEKDAKSITNPSAIPIGPEEHTTANINFFDFSRRMSAYDAQSAKLGSQYVITAATQLHSIVPTRLNTRAPLVQAEKESPENYMARVAFEEEVVIPVELDNNPQTKEFVNLDNNRDGVLKNTEVFDNLHGFVKEGQKLKDLLPFAVRPGGIVPAASPQREHLIEVGNYQHIDPASEERLKEIMNTEVFAVKEGASNAAILKPLDVDGNKSVTVGELKYCHLQPEPGVKTAQVVKP